MAPTGQWLEHVNIELQDRKDDQKDGSKVLLVNRFLINLMNCIKSIKKIRDHLLMQARFNGASAVDDLKTPLMKNGCQWTMEGHASGKGNALKDSKVHLHVMIGELMIE